MHAGSSRAEDCTGKLQQLLPTPEPELLLCTRVHDIYLDASAPVMHAGLEHPGRLQQRLLTPEREMLVQLINDVLFVAGSHLSRSYMQALAELEYPGKLQQLQLTPEPELPFFTILHDIYLDASAPVMHAGSGRCWRTGGSCSGCCQHLSWSFCPYLSLHHLSLDQTFLGHACRRWRSWSTRGSCSGCC